MPDQDEATQLAESLRRSTSQVEQLTTQLQAERQQRQGVEETHEASSRDLATRTGELEAARARIVELETNAARVPAGSGQRVSSPHASTLSPTGKIAEGLRLAREGGN